MTVWVLTYQDFDEFYVLGVFSDIAKALLAKRAAFLGFSDPGDGERSLDHLGIKSFEIDNPMKARNLSWLMGAA
jgi:hypothetical protein